MRLAIVLALCTMAGFGLVHQYEKGDNIAAGLAPSPASYAPLNKELVGQFVLGDKSVSANRCALSRGSCCPGEFHPFLCWPRVSVRVRTKNWAPFDLVRRTKSPAGSMTPEGAEQGRSSGVALSTVTIQIFPARARILRLDS